MIKKMIILCIFTLILSGCGKAKITNENLRCEKKQDVNGNTLTETISATFENKSIQSADIRMETLVADKYIEYFPSLEEQIKQKYSEYYNKQGINIDIISDDGKIAVKINLDFELLDSESKSILGLDSFVSTYDETKRSLIQSGYKCK